MKLLLAIDGGGTRTRCIAVDPSGAVKGYGESGPSNHLHVPIGEATQALATATAAALQGAGVRATDVVLVSAGLAGVDFDGSGANDAAGMLRTVGFDRAVVHGDMVIAHHGALAGAAGVVALAGTGSSVLGTTADGTMLKGGGWGPLYGDQGSAYQLGYLGLTAAAEAFDGSGPTTTLLPALTRALGVPEFPDTVTRLYANSNGQQHLAALAPVVNACAEEGDDVAVKICQRAGSDMARAVVAVARRLASMEPLTRREAPRLVSYQGAVLTRARLVREALLRALQSDAPNLEVNPPRFDPIVGAALLGARAAGWDLTLERMEMPGGI